MSSLTKIFIVLQLVCALVLSVMVVMLVARQEPYRIQVEAERQRAYAAQAALAAEINKVANLDQQLRIANDERTNAAKLATQELERVRNESATRAVEIASLNAKNAQMQAAVNQANASVDSLSKQLAAKDEEIRRIAPENVQLINRNADLTRANNELSTALRFAEQSIRKLQEQLATAAETKSGAAGVSDVGTVANLTSQPPAQINGKVSSVTPTAGRTLLALPLGTRDGLKVGTRLIVYREPGGFIADAVVERVSPAESVAAVDPKSVKRGETVRAGDLVISANSR